SWVARAIFVTIGAPIGPTSPTASCEARSVKFGAVSAGFSVSCLEKACSTGAIGPSNANSRGDVSLIAFIMPKARLLKSGAVNEGAFSASCLEKACTTGAIGPSSANSRGEVSFIAFMIPKARLLKSGAVNEGAFSASCLEKACTTGAIGPSSASSAGDVSIIALAACETRSLKNEFEDVLSTLDAKAPVSNAKPI
ncbi:MAG: hypothetical protein WDW20_06535, partial [Neisseriaceae bacterium]